MDRQSNDMNPCVTSSSLKPADTKTTVNQICMMEDRVAMGSNSSSLLFYVIFYILLASSLSYFFCHHCSSLSVICHNQVIRKEHPNSQHAYPTNLILDYGRIVDQEPKHPFDPLCSSWKATDQRQLSNNPETSCSYFAVEPSIHR